ncbi:enoyl-CoA hydratase/isomerase family protein [Williamsia serinedens]|uniref:2-(1,2-epoxy-1,2-dihydrophenyl)acetyl-CoA isomerase n=1 Tax=Williamsia serinedens TaxID=391736 RepID=A0ABT1H849_9NOCA|nr:enoyl-CoA hydratase-related protein [Williamsia serinedens]MCP2162790.1 2-(1,2-epoxy-1,2-dihydrophenyl)acetyl-CoA isomerase [Williamsia serinedens]
MTDSEYVSESDGVLTITVSTAAAGTSLAPGALVDGAAALREVAGGRRDVGAVLLVGAGANFCAGGDVRAFAGADDRSLLIRDLADTFHEFIRALRDADRPVVAAVTGWAAGAGMSIVLHADVAVAGPSSRLRPAYPGIGLTPDGGMTWMLSRAVGPARARRIILTDEIVDADAGLALGVLSTVVADDDVRTTAADTARTLADGPREALSAAKDLLTAALTTDLDEHLDLEAASIARMAGRPDGIEGVDAFVERRRPSFS